MLTTALLGAEPLRRFPLFPRVFLQFVDLGSTLLYLVAAWNKRDLHLRGPNSHDFPGGTYTMSNDVTRETASFSQKTADRNEFDRAFAPELTKTLSLLDDELSGGNRT